MRLRYLAYGALIIPFIMAGLFGPRIVPPPPVPSDVADPAFAFYARDSQRDYASINSWAFYGMRAERFFEVLGKAGYACQVPNALQIIKAKVEILDATCSKKESWPLSRTLTIQAKIGHGLVNRLVGASAHSDLIPADQPYTQFLAGWLRRLDWMEPEKLASVGVQIKDMDTLVRMIVDGLSPANWRVHCNEELNFVLCQKTTAQRSSNGFPNFFEKQISVSTARGVLHAMALINFTPLQLRGPDNYPADSLLVRVADGKMMQDFVSQDMAGRHFAVSVDVSSAGGAPTSMVVTLDGESKSYPLQGSTERNNDNSLRYLVPEAGSNDTRHAIWLELPNKNFPASFERFQRNMQRTDPHYVEAMAHAIIDDLVGNISVEENLDLYPALWQVEQKAAMLRSMHPETWMSEEQGVRLFASAYPDNLIIRAAWAFATCETGANPTIISRECLQGFASADPDAAAMVRSDLAKQQLIYGDLPDTHPLVIRLALLNDALNTKSNETTIARP